MGNYRSFIRSLTVKNTFQRGATAEVGLAIDEFQKASQPFLSYRRSVFESFTPFVLYVFFFSVYSTVKFGLSFRKSISLILSLVVFLLALYGLFLLGLGFQH